MADTPVPIRLTYGYSRDHRPDLKQFVMNRVCWGEGDCPAFLEFADGNRSDKARFAELLLACQQQWQFEGLFVADSALYSAPNLQALGGLRWLTRVPLTLTAATELVSTLPDTAMSHKSEVPANHNEAQNSALRCKTTAYPRRQNHYAKRTSCGITVSVECAEIETQLGSPPLVAWRQAHSGHGHGIYDKAGRDHGIALKEIS
ncbi:MAG: IS1634 family transposase [Leptolyngbyaceae cyanobacterium]